MSRAERTHEGAALDSRERGPEEVEALWEDKKIVSLSFRRHGRYDTERGSEKVGSLTVPGIEEAGRAARNWSGNLPKDVRVTIHESPSFLIAGERQYPTPHKVKPRRATITASLYEKEIFGKLAPAKIDEKSGMLQSTRRKQTDLLGDLMEHITTREQEARISAFFETRAEIYGKDMERFWHDFSHGRLDPRLQEALKACGGSDSLDLATNLTEFISGAGKAESADKKNVILGLTHGETMESFLYQLGEFFKTKGHEAEGLGETSFSYNEGFDVHIDGAGNLVVVLPGGKNFGVNLHEFREYLDSLKA